ncbi:MAG: hypothetical protein IJW15_01165 [Clostridia bacterium]|nr:hypothetical protein [Clostridia bacterium]
MAVKSQSAKCEIIENAASEISVAANKLEINSLKNENVDLSAMIVEIDKI